MRSNRPSLSVPNQSRTSTIIRVAKWLGTPIGGGATTTTRAKDSDRQDTCKILDNALNDGELSMEERRERISTATNAVTLGDLQALVADLQTDSAPVSLPAVKSPLKFAPWGLLAAAYVASVLLGVGIGWACTATPAHHWTSPRIPEPNPTELPPWC